MFKPLAFQEIGRLFVDYYLKNRYSSYMALQDKLILTRCELSTYLMKERFPVYVVDEAGIIIYRVEYYKNNKVKIFNYGTEMEKSCELSECYTSSKLISLKDKIYTVKGMVGFLDKLDKEKPIKIIKTK